MCRSISIMGEVKVVVPTHGEPIIVKRQQTIGFHDYESTERLRSHGYVQSDDIYEPSIQKRFTSLEYICKTFHDMEKLGFTENEKLKALDILLKMLSTGDIGIQEITFDDANIDVVMWKLFVSKLDDNKKNLDKGIIE